MSKQIWFTIINGKRKFCEAATREEARRQLGEGSIYAGTREEWQAAYVANLDAQKASASNRAGVYL